MASNVPSYSTQVDQQNILRLREMLAELPDYCRTYFRGIEPRTQSRTRIAYAYDLKIFFSYLMENNPEIAKYETIQNIPIRVLDQITPTDLEEYMELL